MSTDTVDPKHRAVVLEAIVSAFKSGARWDGDAMSFRWAEILFLDTAEREKKVKAEMELHYNGVDYLIKDGVLHIGFGPKR